MQGTVRLTILFGLLGLASVGYALNENDPCTNPNRKSGRCIYYRECLPVMNIYNKSIVTELDSRFIQDSRCGHRADKKPLVCCEETPSPTHAGMSRASRDQTTSLLPKAPFCGVSMDDRIYGGQKTALDEFPWTGLLKYRKSGGRTEFRCGASLINSRYVVTAAHCIDTRSWEVIGVRLGEWDQNEEIDCSDGDCADAPVNMDIEKIVVHEGYDPQAKAVYNDIALIRFTKDVNMTRFVFPICLPIVNAQRSLDNVGIKGWAAGWGVTQNGTRSNFKLKVKLEFQDLKRCARTYRPTGVVLKDTQMCAGGVRGEDTCTGDSGGPLTRKLNPFHYLYGIVSFGSYKCGANNVPGIYTNVAKYIDWIEANME